MQLIQKLAENIQAMNPQTQRMIGLIVIGTVAFAGIVGPILLLIGFLPMIAGGFVALAGAMLPITIGLGILAAAVVIGITAWKNWDKVVDFLQRVFHSKFFWLLPGGPLIKALVFLVQNWKTVWNFVKDTLRGAADIILQKVENILNGFVDMVNGVIRVAKRLGFMKDVAEIEQFSLSFEDMKESAQTAMVELVGVVAEKGKEFGGAIKEAMIDVAGDAADFFNKQMDAAGLGFKEMTDAVAEGVDAAIPKLGTELPDALDKTGKAFERAGEKAKSFNDLVSAGQFKSRVRGGRPEMVAWGAGGAKVSKMPSFMDDPRVAEQLLMSVAAMANPTARAQRLQGLIGSGGAIDPKFNQLIAHIKSADVFTKQQMIDFEKPYRLALKKEKEQKALEESQLLSENMMANGGIVTRPTVALVGEAGPEAIIPLGRGRGMAPVYNITISNNTVFGEMDFKRLVVKAVTDSHRRGGLPFLGKA
jgi:division protein CdvB (Snf7/Vps24/ESCRT-III family)